MAAVTASGVPVELLANVAGEPSVGILSGERDRGTSNAHFQSNPEWNRTLFNPRAASVTTKGAAGAVGTTEVLIGGGVPVLFGGVIFEDDSTANEDILLRDAVAVSTSQAAQSIGATITGVGAKFLNGLCVGGTALGVSAVILWRPLGANS